MSEQRPLLIELGTDELPVKALPGLARAFFDGVVGALEKRGITVERGDARPLYTPRRLALLLPAVAVRQPQQHSEVLGPYRNIALDADGQPTRALQGFAAKAGVDWTALETMTDAKGERFVHRAVRPGEATAALLPDVLDEAIAAMPIPKPMRWGADDFAFARPVHWLLVLLGNEVVDAEVMGVRSGRHSRGHRFMHDAPVAVDAPAAYVEALCAAKVLVDADERRARIVREVEAAAQAVGGKARIEDDNLEQVNCLVEWPVAVGCAFDPEFLAVPAEALIATMEANQKYFPVLDANGALTEHFVGIANIESRDVAEVRKGYERVIRPRFADARFFFEEDLKQGLEAMGEGLAGVTYQARLGSTADKVARVTTLVEAIAADAGVDPAQARRAAQLAKNDLQSRMVNEFPELQGIAGRHYALAAGEPAAVADAIDQAWMPRFGGDAIAPSRLGQVLAVADRLDTLAGGFAAGLKPTGNKDAFALRRNALGLARTLLEGGFDLLPHDLLQQAAALQPVALDAAGVLELTRFVYERLRGYYADAGVTPQQFDAVLGVVHDSLPDFDARLQALRQFAALPEAEALAAANKRIGNILRKVDGAIADRVDAALFAEDAERALAAAVDAAIADTDPALARRDYVAVLSRLAQLRPQVDAFFDQVMVNADDPAVRGNRQALLQRLSQRLGAVAAIEHLSG
ncbi:MAG: glycine--tRNA ligase subunit beta [Pseudoxanthomonas suwonensis]|nr:glycine--tRNA ligase subunit beta [Pseudoxanthomonas suwonensis]